MQIFGTSWSPDSGKQAYPVGSKNDGVNGERLQKKALAEMMPGKIGMQTK